MIMPKFHESFLGLPKTYDRIEAKPNKVTMIPHAFYTIHARSTPIKGEWVQGEMIEDFSEKSLSKGI